MAVEKMVVGRLRKYYEDVVLMEQKFIMNDTLNIKVCDNEITEFSILSCQSILEFRRLKWCTQLE